MDSFAPSTHGHGLAAPAISPPSAASPVSPGPAAQRAANRKVEQLLRRTLSNSSASRANPSNIAYRPLHPVPVALPTLTRPNVAAGYRHVVAGSNRASSPLSPAALITSPDSITSPLASPRSPHHGQPPTASPSTRYSAVVANNPISPKVVGQLRRPSIVYAGSPQRTVISEPSPAVSLIGSIAAASTLEMGEREVGVARARSGPGLLKRVSRGISDGTARRVRGYAIRWWWKQRAFNSPGFPLVIGLSALAALCTFIASTTTVVIDRNTSPTPECTLARIYLIFSACLSAVTLATSLAANLLHWQHQSWWSHSLSQLVTATTNAPNSPSTLSSFATSLPASIAPTPPPSPAPQAEPPKSNWVAGVTWMLAIIRVLRLLTIGSGLAALVLVVERGACVPLIVGTAVNLALVALHALAWIGLFALTFTNLPRALHLQAKLANRAPDVAGGLASRVHSKLAAGMHMFLAPLSKTYPDDDPHIVQYHPSTDPSTLSGQQNSWAAQIDPDSTRCPICLGHFSAGDTLARVPSHANVPGSAACNVYHQECLQAWPHSDACPDCGLACNDPTLAASAAAAPSAASESQHAFMDQGSTLVRDRAGAGGLARHASTKSKRSAVFIRDYWLGVTPSAAAARQGGEYALAVPRPSTDAEEWAAQVLGVATEMEGWTWTPGASREGSVEVERGGK